MLHWVHETDKVRIEGTCNFDELPPERQEELRNLYAKLVVEGFFRRLQKGEVGGPDRLS